MSQSDFSKLPLELRKILMGAADQDSVSERVSGYVADMLKAEEMKPIRTVKMTRRVVAKFNELKAWSEKAGTQHERLISRINAINDEIKGLLARKMELNDEMFALINIDMGLPSSTYSMRLNEKTNEVEILEVSPNAPPENKDKKMFKKRK